MRFPGGKDSKARVTGQGTEAVVFMDLIALFILFFTVLKSWLDMAET